MRCKVGFAMAMRACSLAAVRRLTPITCSARVNVGKRKVRARKREGGRCREDERGRGREEEGGRKRREEEGRWREEEGGRGRKREEEGEKVERARHLRLVDPGAICNRRRCFELHVTETCREVVGGEQVGGGSEERVEERG
jgi:hypothetical protein